MTYNQYGRPAGRPDRRSIRLKGYDYNQAGAYFVTIVTQDRAHLFGEVVGGDIRLNAYGQIVRRCWQEIPMHFPNASVDDFIVMPNHVHGIIVIMENDIIVGATHASPQPSPQPGPQTSAHPPRPHGPQRRSVASIVGSFKSAASRRINDLRGTPGQSVWQRNYYEHIIRDDESLNRIRQYILDNPARWALDQENPAAAQPEPEDAWRI